MCFHVNMYDNVSHCEDLTKLTPDTIISVFLSMLRKVSKVGSLEDQVRAISFKNVCQPHDEKQDANFDKILAFVFVHIASLIPTSTDETLANVQANREQKLLDSVASTCGLMGTPGNYIVDEKSLNKLRVFMNNNTDILTYTFNQFLALCNTQSQRTPVYAYARSLLPELHYSNMPGVSILEDYIISGHHPCLDDKVINACVTDYLKSKANLRTLSPHCSWEMIGLVHKEQWESYSMSRSWKRLRILSTIFASEEEPAFDKIEIDGEKIAAHKIKSYYYYFWFRNAYQFKEQREKREKRENQTIYKSN